MLLDSVLLHPSGPVVGSGREHGQASVVGELEHAPPAVGGYGAFTVQLMHRQNACATEGVIFISDLW